LLSVITGHVKVGSGLVFDDGNPDTPIYLYPESIFFDTHETMLKAFLEQTRQGMHPIHEDNYGSNGLN